MGCIVFRTNCKAGNYYCFLSALPEQLTPNTTANHAIVIIMFFLSSTSVIASNNLYGGMSTNWV